MSWTNRLLSLIRQRRLRQDLEDELAFHQDARAREFAAAGLSEDEARRAARRRFGNATLIQEDCHRIDTITWIETVLQDLRYGLRMFRRSPGFTAVAVLSLTLGIGANTVIFSLIDVSLLKTYPFRNPEEIVDVRGVFPNNSSFSFAEFEQFRDRNHVFSGIFSHDGTTISASIDGQPEIVRGALVSGSYFSVLGVDALLGRTFMEGEDTPAKAHIAVLSHQYWERRFSRDPRVLGKIIQLNRIPFTVIGVMPPEFQGQSSMMGAPDLWTPMSTHVEIGLKDHTEVGITARLKPNVVAEQAGAELTAIHQRFLADEAGASAPQKQREILKQSIAIRPGGAPPGDDDWHLPVLSAAVGLILLIACANIANLMMARASARGREIAVRLAIGAGRSRLVRQFLTESILLAIVGGATALLLVHWGSEALPSLLRQSRVNMSLELDWRVLCFTAALSMLTGIAFGLAPSLQASGARWTGLLKFTAGHRRRAFPSRLLVVGQVALSLMLLVGAGLLIRTVQKLASVTTGFNQDQVLLAQLLPIWYDAPAEIRLYRDVLARLNALPGVRSASLSRIRLVQGGAIRRIAAADQPRAYWNAVMPRFFATMGIPLLLGRDVADTDTQNSARVAVISQSLARRCFSGEDPLGKRIEFTGGAGGAIVIGVVGDIVSNIRRLGVREAIFVPYAQAPATERGQAMLAIRTAGNPMSIVPFLRREVQAVDPNLPLEDIGTQAQTVARTSRSERALAKLTGFFGLLALLLASIGIYGTVSWSVTQRTQEIGIRMALGAARGNVMGMVLGETLLLVLAGMAAGLPLALAATRLISSMLYGVSAGDPLTLTVAGGILLGVAAMAGFLPACRASRIDPILALRYE